jgi:hypothetical protein
MNIQEFHEIVEREAEKRNIDWKCYKEDIIHLSCEFVKDKKRVSTSISFNVINNMNNPEMEIIYQIKKEKENMYSEEMKQNAKDAIEILTAVVEGKEVQYKDGGYAICILGKEKESVIGAVLSFIDRASYTIKETPEYVSFERMEEVIPFIGSVLKHKDEELYVTILGVHILKYNKEVVLDTFGYGPRNLKDIFNTYIFADTGLPFGKLKGK